MIDWPAPPSNGTDTSAAAAAYIAPYAASMRERVLDAIRATGTQGTTMGDICAATGICRSSVCGRIGELRKLRLIADSGMRRRPPGAPVNMKVFLAVEHYGAFLRIEYLTHTESLS